MHVHAAPDPYAERRLPSDVLVERAVEAGMGGLVLKSHEYNTQPLAWLLDQQNEDIRVYGGIALDHGVGGLNMEAVNVAMLIGTTMVWMPTFDAQAWRDARPGGRHSPAPGITVLDEMGDLRHEVMAILDLIHEHDAVLATGHLSSPEVAVLVRESRRRGIRTVVTHGSFYIDLEVQQEMAGLGAYVEQVATAHQPRGRPGAVGADRVPGPRRRPGARDPLDRLRPGGETRSRPSASAGGSSTSSTPATPPRTWAAWCRRTRPR